MNWSLFLNWFLGFLAAILTFFICLVLYRFFKLGGAIQKEIKPTISRVQTLIDEINTELERAEEIVKQAQSVSRKVDTTTKVAQEIISSPLIRLAALSAGFKKAFDTFTKRKV